MRRIIKKYTMGAGCLTPNAKGVFKTLLMVASLVTASAYADSVTPRVKQLESNASNSCVLFNSGEVSCWGTGSGLGSGASDNSNVPVPVVGINDPNSRLTGVKALARGSGFSFHCALLRSREVACWGLNQTGQLGNITTQEVTDFGAEFSSKPVMVRDISGSGHLDNVKQVVTGVSHACALLQGGRVACWGSNSLSQLGSDEADELYVTDTFSSPYSSVPLLVKGTSGAGQLTGVRKLSNGSFHTCGILRNGDVVCWGSNFRGELGVPTDSTEDSQSTTPVIAHPGDRALKRVKQIATGGSSTCALSVRGTVSCWGGNFFGGLGDGTFEDSLTPVAVRPIGGGEGRLRGVRRLSSNGSTVCAELRNRGVACWGGNPFGKLGNGSTEKSSVPVVPLGIDGVGTLSLVRQISPSTLHSCALQKRNQVSCWGINLNGELGNGTNENSLFPVRVVDLH